MVESQAGSDDVVEARLGEIWDRSIAVEQTVVATYLPLGVPEAVLFGKDGRVLASSEMLRGEPGAHPSESRGDVCGSRSVTNRASLCHPRESGAAPRNLHGEPAPRRAPRFEPLARWGRILW